MLSSSELQAEIDKLEQLIARYKATLAEMNNEQALFEQEALKDQHGTVIAIVHCHIWDKKP